MEEEFNIEALIKWASRYPEFEEKFIETFDSKESLEVCLKLTININDYFETEYIEAEYDYENMIRDLGIQFKIYKNEEEFEDDYYNEKYIEKDFFDFYERLEKYYTEFYEKLKEKGITNKYMMMLLLNHLESMELIIILLNWQKNTIYMNIFMINILKSGIVNCRSLA